MSDSASPSEIRGFFDEAELLAAELRELNAKFTAIRDRAIKKKVDWAQLKALAIACDADKHDEKNKGRVAKILNKHTYGSWYAEILHLDEPTKMNNPRDGCSPTLTIDGVDHDPPPAPPSSDSDEASIDRPDLKNAPARNSGRIKGGPARARASRAARAPAAEPTAAETSDNAPRTAVMANEGVAGPGALAAQTASGPPKDALPVPSPAAQDGSAAAGDVLSSPAAPDSEPALVEALIDRGEAGAAGDTAPGAGSPPAAEPGDGPIPAFLRRDPAAKWWGGM